MPLLAVDRAVESNAAQPASANFTTGSIGRDLLIVTGAVVYRLHTGALRGEPTRISKLNTLLQLCYVLVVIAARAWPLLPAWLIVWTGAGVFVTTVVSGLDYVLTYARRAARAERPAGA